MAVMAFHSDRQRKEAQQLAGAVWFQEWAVAGHHPHPDPRRRENGRSGVVSGGCRQLPGDAERWSMALLPAECRHETGKAFKSVVACSETLLK